MLDWEGNIVEAKHRQQFLLSETEENPRMAASAIIADVAGGQSH